MPNDDKDKCVHKLGPQCFCAQAREDYAEACQWAVEALEHGMTTGDKPERLKRAMRVLQLELLTRARIAQAIPMRLPSEN